METRGTTREESITMAAIQSINDKLPDLELRDMFAMSALQALIPTPWGQSSDTSFEAISDTAYSIADKMIEARKKKN
jgi:hypothetical protein